MIISSFFDGSTNAVCPFARQQVLMTQEKLPAKEMMVRISNDNRLLIVR